MLQHDPMFIRCCACLESAQLQRMVTLVQPGMPRRGVGFSDIAADVLQTLNRADLVTVLADMRVLTAAQLARVLRRMADRIEDDGVVVLRAGPGRRPLWRRRRMVGNGENQRRTPPLLLCTARPSCRVIAGRSYRISGSALIVGTCRSLTPLVEARLCRAILRPKMRSSFSGFIKEGISGQNHLVCLQ
jgi:hypothetical protein